MRRRQQRRRGGQRRYMLLHSAPADSAAERSPLEPLQVDGTSEQWAARSARRRRGCVYNGPPKPACAYLAPCRSRKGRQLRSAARVPCIQGCSTASSPGVAGRRCLVEPRMYPSMSMQFSGMSLRQCPPELRAGQRHHLSGSQRTRCATAAAQLLVEARLQARLRDWNM